MTHSTPIAQSELVAAMALAGFVFGLLYFSALRRSVALFVGDDGRFVPLTLTLGRIAAAVAFLSVSARLGAASLLAAFVGFLIARAAALRAKRKAG